MRSARSGSMAANTATTWEAGGAVAVGHRVGEAFDPFEKAGGPGRGQGRRGQRLGDPGQRRQARILRGDAYGLLAKTGGMVGVEGGKSFDNPGQRVGLVVAVSDGIGQVFGLLEQAGGVGRVGGGESLGERGKRHGLSALCDGDGEALDLLEEAGGARGIQGGQRLDDFDQRPYLRPAVIHPFHVSGEEHGSVQGRHGPLAQRGRSLTRLDHRRCRIDQSIQAAVAYETEQVRCGSAALLRHLHALGPQSGMPMPVYLAHAQ